MDENLPQFSLDKRLFALKKRLTFDFQPVQNALSKGLELNIQPEAAVYCTAAVEAVCELLLDETIEYIQRNGATNFKNPDMKILSKHFQLVVRTSQSFFPLSTSVEAIGNMLNYFLDINTSKFLLENNLIEECDAKHLSNDDNLTEEELNYIHEKSQVEWQKRRDDPFTEVDFASVLKCVDPAYTLAHDANAFMSAWVRELLNAFCSDIDFSVVNQDLSLAVIQKGINQTLRCSTEINDHVVRVASDCVDRFRLQSRKDENITIQIHFRKHAKQPPIIKQINAKRRSLIARVCHVARKKFRVENDKNKDRFSYVFIYRGVMLYEENQSSSKSTSKGEKPSQLTLADLSISTKATFFLLPRQWWDNKRRNEARRGMMVSVADKDHQSHIQKLREQAVSKVKNGFSFPQISGINQSILQANLSPTKNSKVSNKKQLNSKRNNSNQLPSIEQKGKNSTTSDIPAEERCTLPCISMTNTAQEDLVQKAGRMEEIIVDYTRYDEDEGKTVGGHVLDVMRPTTQSHSPTAIAQESVPQQDQGDIVSEPGNANDSNYQDAGITSEINNDVIGVENSDAIEGEVAIKNIREAISGLASLNTDIHTLKALKWKAENNTFLKQGLLDIREEAMRAQDLINELLQNMEVTE